ncbi:MAG: Cna B-type domain-containing protein, partial [Oscillospiraceae bacterium]|nr:Cna B-type domain-containing protein [Oscillospiraceae bacterium]
SVRHYEDSTEYKVKKIEITFKSENDGEDEDEDDPVVTPPSDTVTFDETNKILTVIPGDGSLGNIEEVNFNGWLYKIPTEYYNYNITNVKITRSDSGLTSGVIYISRNNNGKFSWDGYVEGKNYSGNTIELSGANYSLSNYDGYGICLRDDSSSSKVQKLEITFATKGTTPQYTQGNTTHNFTTNGTLSSFYTISGNLATDKGTITYNNISLTQCLKIESTTNISFTNSNAGTLTLVFSADAKDKKILVDEAEKSITDNGSGVYTLTLNLSAGSHTIKKANNSGSNVNLCYMSYNDSVPDTIQNMSKYAEFKEKSVGDNFDILYVNKDSDFKNYQQKKFTKFEVHYRNASVASNNSDWFGIHKHSSLWSKADAYDIFQSNVSTSNNIVTYDYDDIPVTDFYENGFYRMQTDNPKAIQKIVFYFTDTSDFTLWNNVYSANEVLDNSKDISLNSSSTDYQSGLLTKTEVNAYLDKTLSQIVVNFGKNITVNNNQVDNLSIYLNKSDNNWITNTGLYSNGTQAVYQYNHNTLTNHNLSDDFFRVKTTRNTEIKTIVLEFTDGSKFTMKNNSYVEPVILTKSKEVEIKYDTEQYDLITKSDLSEYLNKKITRLETFYDNVKDIELNSTTFIHLRGTDGNQKSHDGGQGVDNNNNSGYFGYNSWGLDQLNDNLLYLKTTVNKKIHKIVFTFDDGSTYTLINTTYNLYEPPTEPEKPKEVHLSSSITLTKITDFTTKSDGNPTVEHEQFGFADETIRSQYLSKYVNRVDIYYRDMLIGFPNYLSDTAIYLIRSQSGANKYPYQYVDENGQTKDSHYWCPDQTDYNFDDNIATWYYKEELADDLGEKFFRIKTSRPDEISKIVINFTDGSTYTMNNTAYVASSKVESSEDDYTYNTGEYVLIAKITLTADGGWRHTLDNLPATDGQGNAYTYHIKETNIYGSDADKYKVLNYTHANGIVLENDSNDIGVTNERKADENINVLPNTGGTGAKGYFIAGIIVMICSAAGYTVIKRRLIR